MCPKLEGPCVAWEALTCSAEKLRCGNGPDNASNNAGGKHMFMGDSISEYFGSEFERTLIAAKATSSGQVLVTHISHRSRSSLVASESKISFNLPSTSQPFWCMVKLQSQPKPRSSNTSGKETDTHCKLTSNCKVPSTGPRPSSASSSSRSSKDTVSKYSARGRSSRASKNSSSEPPDNPESASCFTLCSERSRFGSCLKCSGVMIKRGSLISTLNSTSCQSVSAWPLRLLTVTVGLRSRAMNFVLLGKDL
mmetsp:Transcript_27575/g.63758  ORF Transcript_27575/g.63758 Transcript_27575/m.63758 type:complete len:251 (-) Transcript_27575:794-1546(-)